MTVLPSANTLAQRLPSHVPPALVHEFDLYRAPTGAGLDSDPQSQLAWIADRGLPDLFWSTANGGHWVVTRSEEFNHILATPEVFSSSINVVPESRAFKQAPINLDPPDHGKFRSLLNGAFSPKSVSGLAIQARQMTIELIEGMRTQGGCEFIDGFARQVPIGIFMRMVDLPAADRQMLLDIVDSVVRPRDVTDNQAFHDLMAYATKTLAQRRAAPGEDLFSQLLTARVDGELLDDQNILGIFTLLLIAGLDTVASALGFIANFLARNPEYRRQLIERPALIPAATEELLRRFPLSTLVRKVVSDTRLKGVDLRAGDLVLMHTGAQTLDERAFPDPLRVDFERKVVYHGGFGNGAHRCLGSMLARTEIRIFLEEWLTRIPEFELDPGRPWELATGMVFTVEKLYLRWPAC